MCWFNFGKRKRLGELEYCEHVLFKEQLSLPISPQIQKWEIDSIIETLPEAMETLSKKRE